MRSRIQAVLLPIEASEFAEEVRRIFLELGRTSGTETLGECAPPLDLYETETTVEISMDLPGVAPDAVRIVASGSAVLIAGEKVPRRARGDSSFHLVERGYGRFARVVRLPVACNTSDAGATLANGELRVSFPKLTERRGRSIPIRLAHERPVA